MRGPREQLFSSAVVRPWTRRSFLSSAVSASLAAGVLPLLHAEETSVRDSVFELRQYTLYGGRRDTLISLFEANFVESQEAAGAHVVGTFRDLDDPDRFVWIRSFPDMAARKEALEAFYLRSPAWIAHKKEANATIVDSDNVLLLAAPSIPPQFSASVPDSSGPHAVYGITIYYLDRVNAAQFADFFDRMMLPHLNALGAHPIATLATNEVPNNFPRLPVRENDRVFLWIARWPSEASHQAFTAQSRGWSGWRDAAPENFLPALMRKPEQLRLKPTSRSRLQ
jgi:quinol monooxygenase YgiN